MFVSRLTWPSQSWGNCFSVCLFSLIGNVIPGSLFILTVALSRPGRLLSGAPGGWPGAGPPVYLFVPSPVWPGLAHPVTTSQAQLSLPAGLAVFLPRPALLSLSLYLCDQSYVSLSVSDRLWLCSEICPRCMDHLGHTINYIFVTIIRLQTASPLSVCILPKTLMKHILSFR